MSFFRKTRFFIILIGIIVLVALIGYSLNDRDKLSLPEQFINDTVGWAQRIVHAPVKYVSNLFSNLEDIKNTYDENNVLKERLAQYKGMIYEVQELEKENEELRKTLEKVDSLRDFNSIQASVIARSPERWMEQIRIDKGTSNGVEVNMAVIIADGMIGKIQSVSNSTATVQLLTGFDEFNRISGTISRDDEKDVFGLVEEYDAETKSLIFRIIDESDKDVEPGEKVFSSGKGGVFPAGLLIGEVTEVVPDKYGLSNTALVKPAADMYDIDNVIVVDRLLEEGKDAGDEEE
ncbi:MAG TPA: rod shape-determining protein MreC [Bacillota bacterium]|nr:rod shape-determining protein MreC [Bacillota bacterium]